MASFHMGGLASGYDVQGIIDNMVKIRSVPRQTWVTEEDAITLDVAAWSDISVPMTALTDSLDVLRSSDTWSKMLASISDQTKLSATASASATKATHSIGITQLAQAHTIASDTASQLGVASSSVNLVGTVLTSGEKFTIGTGANTVTITIGITESLATLSGKINTAAAGMSAATRVTASIIDNRLVIARNNSGSTQIPMAELSGTPLADLGIFESAKPQAPSGNLLWLEMQANNSPTVTDSSANGNNGAEVNGAVWNPSGRFDGGYVLNGTTDAISVPATPALDGYDQFTWSMWVKSSAGGTQTLMHYGDRQDSAGITLQLDAGGQPTVLIDDGTTQASVTGTNNLADGAWHLVTVTDNGTTLQIYEDGVATNNVASNAVGYITTNDHDGLEIGRRWDNAAYDNYLNGSVDEAMVFNRALSATEAAALYTPPAQFKNELTEAQDAVFTVDGATVTRSSNSNLTDVISGVTLNLLGATTNTVSLTIGNDTETAKTAIMNFITAYNDAAKKLTDYGKIELNGTAAKGATINTDTQGELSDDPLVAELLRNLRSQATDSKYPALNSTNATYTFDGRTGVMNSLGAIGIGTVGTDNQLELTDEDRLDSGLSNYFDKVEQLFRGVFDSVNGYQNGVATDFYEYSYNASTSLTGSIAKHTSQLNDKYAEYQAKIAKFDDDLETYTQDLWEEFTAMDDTISKLQAQLAGLQQIQGK